MNNLIFCHPRTADNELCYKQYFSDCHSMKTSFLKKFSDLISYNDIIS